LFGWEVAATVGLVLAVQGMVTTAMSVAAWAAGGETTNMDEPEKKVIKAIGRELGWEYAPYTSKRVIAADEVCWTYHRVRKLLDTFKQIESSLPQLESLCAEKAKKPAHKRKRRTRRRHAQHQPG
jgi:hypothetical protein